MPNGIRHEFIIAISPPFTSLHPEGDSAVPMCFVSDAPARVDLLIAISSAEALLPDSIAARAKLRSQSVSLIESLEGTSGLALRQQVRGVFYQLDSGAGSNERPTGEVHGS